MTRRLGLAMLPFVALLLSSAAPATIAEQRARLAAAKLAAEQATMRSRTLERAAETERDAAVKARRQEAAVAQRITRAEADIAAAQAQVAITDGLLGQARTRLAERQAPLQRLVAALQSMARRPNALAVVRPGSTRDIVHVRAVLGTLAPVVAQRSAAVRAEIARVRKLRADADLAAKGLRDGRASLQTERLALVRMEGEHRLRSRALDRNAMFESDRAIALGEQARDLVDLMEETEAAADTGAVLAQLPGPLPRPATGDETASARFAIPPYRLPAAGRVVEGLGELSRTGVRSRGLTLSTAAGAPVTAPSAGRVLFARKFRGYGIVVILDHGSGWSSALTGLAAVDVKAGDSVEQGAPIGRAATGEDPRVTVELRRRGVPVDLTPLLS